MKLAVCEAMRHLPDELESGDHFEVVHIVQYLYLLKKIDYPVLNNWAQTEKSQRIIGYIKEFSFYYSDIDINNLDGDEERVTTLRLIHRLINEELKQLELLLV